MKIAIVTQKYPDLTQTPIHHHILNLFGGATVVVCREVIDTTDVSKPVFQCVRGGFWDYGLSGVRESLRNGLMGRSLRVPVGVMRSNLKHFLRQQKVDAVLAEFGTEGLWSWPIAQEMRLPFFVYFRGYDATGFLHATRHRTRRINAYKDMIAASRAVLSVSPFLFRNLMALGIPITNGYVVPSGVDTAICRPSHKDYNLVVSAGRFIEKKAPNLTIKAFALVSRKRPQLRLEMVGDGPLLEQCKQLAFNLEIENKITFHGAKSHSFVQALMSQAGFFMQHSVVASNGDQEGAPTSIQEAMAAGACVISTYHAGIPDLIQDGVTGCLVPEHDFLAYADKLENLLASKLQCTKISQAARNFAVSRLDKSLSNQHIERLISGERVPDWRSHQVLPGK